MRHFTFLLLLLIASSATAQNTPADFKLGLKLSNQSSWNYDLLRNDGNGYLISPRGLRLFQIQPGVLLKSCKGNLWDISLEHFTGSINRPGIANLPKSKPYDLGIGFKVGYFYAFFKQKTTRWMPMLGIEAAPYVSFSRNLEINGSTLISTPYLTTLNHGGVVLYLSPRVMWCPGKRFFMDASLNLGVLRAAFGKAITDNPVSPYAQGTTATVGLPSNGTRLTVGLGLKM